MEYRVHRSEVLQDLYLVQTHFKLEGFKYYESLMEKAYVDLLDKHNQIEKTHRQIGIFGKFCGIM